MIRPASPTARHLYDAIERSPKTQREIAREAGFASQNMLSMMKTGESKVPINRIPRLSQALGIAPATFINTALKEYHPDLHEVIKDQFGIGLSSTERTLLEVFDEAQHVAHFELDAGLCNVLLGLFVFVGRIQEEFGS